MSISAWGSSVGGNGGRTVGREIVATSPAVRVAAVLGGVVRFVMPHIVIRNSKVQTAAYMQKQRRRSCDHRNRQTALPWTRKITGPEWCSRSARPLAPNGPDPPYLTHADGQERSVSNYGVEARRPAKRWIAMQPFHAKSLQAKPHAERASALTYGRLLTTTPLPPSEGLSSRAARSRTQIGREFP